MQKVTISSITYAQALQFQQAQASTPTPDWLFFSCPPVITLGKRAQATDILISQKTLEEKGVAILPVDRGGLVTFHGPGQLVGFPLGTLESHTKDSRAVRLLVDHMVSRVRGVLSQRFLGFEWLCDDPEKTGAGLWRKDQHGKIEKILSIGIRIGKNTEGAAFVSHGFCLNLFRENIFSEALLGEVSGFDCVVPCGSQKITPGFLFSQKPSQNCLEELVQALYRELKGELHETNSIHFQALSVCSPHSHSSARTECGS